MDDETNDYREGQPTLRDCPKEPTKPKLPTPTSPIPVRSEEDGDAITWAKDIPPLAEGETIQSHWGPFIFPGSIQIIAGEAGIGKTTLLYNIVVSLARGESYAGIKPECPIRILYYDLETPELLRRHKLHVVAENNPPDGLAFANSFSLTGALINIKKHDFQVVVIDTINEAFNTRDENDNAEANRQMRELRSLISETGVSVILVGHIGKDPGTQGVYRLRGASARPAAADVEMSLEAKKDDIISLQVEKSRWLGGKDKIFFKKVGEDHFEPIEFSGEETLTTEHRIEEFLASMIPVEPESLETKLILSKSEAAGFKPSTVQKVLSRLTQSNTSEIIRVRQGVYSCRPNPNFRPTGGIGKSELEEIREVTCPAPTLIEEGEK